VPTWAQERAIIGRVLRVIVAVLAISCSSSSRSSQSGPPRRRVITPVAGAPEPLPFTTECVKPTDPTLADLQRRAEAATRQAFEAELARNHLHVLPLAAHDDQLAEGLQYMNSGGAREGSTVKKKLADAEGTFVAAETYWTGNPGGPSPWEFVQDDKGGVFRLVRKPLAAITQAHLCTCRDQRCGPPGSGCPACGSTNQILYGPLPKGAEYRGELELAYQANVVSLEYKENDCPPPPVCEQPP
jgi:hypothetical protein